LIFLAVIASLLLLNNVSGLGFIAFVPILTRPNLNFPKQTISSLYKTSILYILTEEILKIRSIF
jgi:hypothetical protein